VSDADQAKSLVHNRPMRASAVLGWAVNLVAAALVALYLAAALPRAAGVVGFMLRLPGRTAGESLPAARARLFGGEYSRAIDLIRRQIPVEQPYALVAGDSAQSGGVLWVRYDLAPRRAVYLGELGRLARVSDIGGLRAALGSDLQTVVVAYAGAPPHLYRLEDFLRSLGRRDGR
jgi:hypothetical protein